MRDFSQYKLGEHDEVIHVERFEENRNAAICLATQANRSIRILSYDLDPIIYDNAEFIDAVKNIVINSTRADVRILIHDSRKIVDHGHRMVDLARQLSSYISIRKLSPELSNLIESYLIADETGILYRRLADRQEGFVNFDDRGRCRQLLTGFNDAWEKSQPDPELRRLHL